MGISKKRPPDIRGPDDHLASALRGRGAHAAVGCPGELCDCHDLQRRREGRGHGRRSWVSAVGVSLGLGVGMGTTAVKWPGELACRPTPPPSPPPEETSGTMSAAATVAPLRGRGVASQPLFQLRAHPWRSFLGGTTWLDQSDRLIFGLHLKILCCSCRIVTLSCPRASRPSSCCLFHQIRRDSVCRSAGSSTFYFSYSIWPTITTQSPSPPPSFTT